MEVTKKCGCKGIRTCLICEEEENLTRNDDIKETIQYQFCSWCGLCWPVVDAAPGPPLYLGLLTLVPEFVSAEEEGKLQAAIDSLEWMPSQSGRRKQDFGPKVNFKKRKSKIGNFKGFPDFTEHLIKRFERCGDLSDFRPVELCHLDYDPDRGSAIEPHTDDTWIWGERLVTLNLVSSTVLTLTPAIADGPCACQTHCLDMSATSVNETGKCLNISASSIDKNRHCFNMSVSSTDENRQCHCNTDVDSSMKPFSNVLNATNRIVQNGIIESLGCPIKSLEASVSNAGTVKANSDHDQPLFTTCETAFGHVKDLDSTPGQGDCTITVNGHCNLKDPLCFHTKCAKDVDSNPVNKHSIDNGNLQATFDKISLNKKTSNSSENIRQKTQLYKSKVCSHNKFSNCAHGTFLDGRESIAIKDICTVHRIGNERPNIEVLVPLPARSLVVVAGCSRHNWFHEIKRKDVVYRRLAMTFRELAQDFMPGGSEENVGSQLLELGRTFWETNTAVSS